MSKDSKGIMKPLEDEFPIIEELPIEEDCLEETYSDDELDDMIGNVYNLQKIQD